MPSDEYAKTEKPFMDQLAALGWAIEDGDVNVPYLSGDRQNFREVILRHDLREALRRINRVDGEPWLGDTRVGQAVHELERVASPSLMEANQNATRLLRKGTTVDGHPEYHGGRDETIHYIDFKHPEHNHFRAIRQFRVDYAGASGHAIPDIVLFVNGIPLVVVECKSPGATDPVASGVEDLLKYSNQRVGGENEGIPHLFRTNQVMVATSYDKAVAGTVGARPEHYIAWKDTSPVPTHEVHNELGTDSLSQQETLVAGMLRPAHLLQLLKHFILFEDDEGHTIKMVARYQQFRAVHKAVRRLRTGETRLEDGSQDQRGGIVWHTQGSGKSLTMVFLVRVMRSLPELRRLRSWS